MSKPTWLTHRRKNFEPRRRRPKKCLRVGLHREIDAPYDGCSSKICNKSRARARGGFNRLPLCTALKRWQSLTNLGACSEVAPADSVEDTFEASPLCSKVALADLRRRSSRSITSLQQGGSGRLGRKIVTKHHLSAAWSLWRADSVEDRCEASLPCSKVALVDSV